MMLAACWPDGIRIRRTGSRMSLPAAALPSAGYKTTRYPSAGDRLAWDFDRRAPQRNSNVRPTAEKAVSATALISTWLVSSAKHVPLIGRGLPRLRIRSEARITGTLTPPEDAAANGLVLAHVWPLVGRKV